MPAVEKPLSSAGPLDGGAAASAGGRFAPVAALRPDPAMVGDIAAAGRLPRPAPRLANIAALDLGTNNCRLLVARPAGGGFRVVDAFSRIVRLGEGLAATGSLSESAMARTLEALKVCADKIAYRRIASGRYVATEACRRAANCAAFLDRVRDETGIEIEIISTAEEARLVVSGCAPLLDPRIPYAIVFDIGGGSTEIVWLRLADARDRRRRRPQILGSISLPHGVVTLTDRYGGEVSPSDLSHDGRRDGRRPAIRSRSAHRIAPVDRGRVQMLGSSGTVTTLAGIHLALPRYTAPWSTAAA